jgi:hypothetical protein
MQKNNKEEEEEEEKEKNEDYVGDERHCTYSRGKNTEMHYVYWAVPDDV